MIGQNKGVYEGVVTHKHHLINRRGDPMTFFQAAQKFEIHPVTGKFYPRKTKIFPHFFATNDLAEEIYNEVEKGDFVRVHYSLSSYSSKRSGGTATSCRVHGYQKLPHPSGDKDPEKIPPEDWMDLTKQDPPGPWRGNRVFAIDE